MVVNGENMEEVISFHHRKEEISDIKFSPGKGFLQKTQLASHQQPFPHVIFFSTTEKNSGQH